MNIFLEPILFAQQAFANDNGSGDVNDNGDLELNVEESAEEPPVSEDQPEEVPSDTTSEENVNTEESVQTEFEESPETESPQDTEEVTDESTEEESTQDETKEIEEGKTAEEVENTPVTAITTNSNTTSNIRTGSESSFNFNVTNSEAALDQALIRVTLPRSHIDTYEHVANYFPNQTVDANTHFDSTDNLVVEVAAQDLVEDYNENFEFVFKTLDNTLSDGTVIPVKAEVVDENGVIVATTEVVNYNYVTRDALYSTDVTYTEDEEETEIILSHRFSFDDNGVGNGSGELAVEDVTVNVSVPESLSFDLELNEGWTFNEETSVATISVTPDETI
ncbi:hypothetical protein [Aliicoccus persicus]|nr:hypothetical protein [Aliicoccus persicus]